MNKWYSSPKAVSLLSSERCIKREYKSRGTWDTLPRHALLDNISTIWMSLDMIRQDWERASSVYQEDLDKNPEDYYYMIKTMNDLKPVFLKCLFSFAFFSVSLMNAYEALRRDLKELNRANCFRIKPQSKSPIVGPHIKKVREIRNNTIAHMNSNKLDDLDAYYALMWDVSWSKSEDENWHVDNMNFKYGKLIRRDIEGNVIKESIDYQVEGIADFFRETLEYFIQEDASCSNYLTAIEAKLPAETQEYRFTIF